MGFKLIKINNHVRSDPELTPIFGNKTMKKEILLISLQLLIAVYLGSNVYGQHQIQYHALLRQMKDLQRLAELPQTGESCSQWSSWDRRSKYNAETGKYEFWDGNNDGAGNFIREENGKFVMAEMMGPGAIVRIWSAQPEQGHVKIYIDGNEKPVIDMPFISYFDHSVYPFNKEGITYKVSEGYNSYLPISYNKSCKVVADSGWGVYYHFNYITFPKDIEVEPFTMPLDPESEKALNKVNDFFLNRIGNSPHPFSGNEDTAKGDIRIAPGKTIDLATFQGARAIKSIKIYPDFKNRAEAMIGLRKLFIKMDWDQKGNPEVWGPLGDFFGTTPAINIYRTLPAGMTDSVLYTYWYMPFKEGAAIQISNTGEVTYHFSFEIVHEPITDPERYGRFHAKWHGDVGDVPPDQWPDWELLRTKGSGRFLGVMLHVMNLSDGDCVPDSKEGSPWWGEGDEKFFVDGEKFPSTFGTGSEDYFGYAWGNPTLFEKPYHSQNMSMDNRGHQTLVRWHVNDNIPFQKSFDGYLEKYYQNECGTFYNCIVFWYLSPDGEDLYSPVTVSVDHIVLPPLFETENNFCLEGDSVSVKMDTKNLKIYYTLDGSIPDKDAFLYSAELKLKNPCDVMARCYDPELQAWSRTKVVKIRFAEWQAADNVKGLEPGLKYAYYEKDIVWSRLPDFSTMVPVKEGITESVDLTMNPREDNYGVRFSGYIKIMEDGLYRFYLNSDDGSRLYLRDHKIINNDLNHGFLELSGRAALRKGYHPIRIDYYESGLYQGITFSIEKEGMKKQVVSPAMLFHAK